ncbi:epimerase [Tsukamurella strandjordii]|uniref:epimerase n=1 Tax=Tsukamurella TaxID=2060 RepID=UPI002088D196|nr:epimerase [Tsukamurella sp. TY48]GIZ97811.1 epimerase [Tsukamurella sp. TY48]
MRIIIFGATGMVGQGVLEACLLDDTVTDVLVIGRTSTGRTHAKLREIHHDDFGDFTPIRSGEIAGYDACLFCLGTSAVGMSETDYRTITYDYTLAAARVLLDADPDLTFCYVSGAGTDTASRMMWARVKGETENALLDLSERAHMFRPGFIVPLPGTQAKTTAYVVLYRVVTPLYPLLSRIIPGHITTSLRLGRAMLVAARGEVRERILDTAGINTAADS